MTQDRPRVLGLIPARGGSKSIPLKNVATLAGKPLIYYTIQAALESGVLDRLVVSTDSDKIAEAALSAGAEVPFMRPAELALDDTPGIEPPVHALEWFAKEADYRPDYLMTLQPTSPFRTADDIRAAVEIAQDKSADAVVSVCEVHDHPYWTKSISDDGKLADFLPLERDYVRRQDLPPAYVLNGAIYMARAQLILEKRTYYSDDTYAYVMPRERSLDIDTAWDLHLAELLLQREGGR